MAERIPNPMYQYKEHDFSTEGTAVIEGKISLSMNNSPLIGSTTDEFGDDYCNLLNWMRYLGLKVDHKYRIVVEEIK